MRIFGIQMEISQLAICTTVANRASLLGYTFSEVWLEIHSSVLELRKNQFLKKINVLKTFLEIETTHYLEDLDLKLSNETYAKDFNL